MDDNKLDLILKKLEKLQTIEKSVLELKADVKDIKNIVNNYMVKDISNLDKRIESLERKAQ
jgi:hypothetical protein